MLGPYGGLLLRHQQWTTEQASLELVRVFAEGPHGAGARGQSSRVARAEAPGPEPVADPHADATPADTIAVWRSGDELIIDADLADLPELRVELDAKHDVDQPAAVADRLDVLAAVAARVTALHAKGIIHGDLRPATIRVGSYVGLLVAEHGVDAASWLAMRLRCGAASARDVAFAAPEIVSGATATPASDVYALAALTVGVVRGCLPLGLLDSAELRATLTPEAVEVLRAALNADPRRRPDANALALALHESARRLRQPAGRSVSRHGRKQERAREERIPLAFVGFVAATIPLAFHGIAGAVGRDAWELMSVALDPSSVEGWGRTKSAGLFVPLLAISAPVLALLAPRVDRGTTSGIVLAPAIELAALAVHALVFGLLSVATLRTDLLYAAILVAGAALALVLGVMRRHVAHGVAASLIILITITLHYFAKLSTLVHWGALAVGFGVMLLGIAVLYERRIRPLLRERAPSSVR